MLNGDEKRKNSEQANSFLQIIKGIITVLGVCALLTLALVSALVNSNSKSDRLPLPDGIRVNVDSAQGWQPTGLRLEEGQGFIVQFIEGDWSIFPQDSFRYGPDGGASACNNGDCVEPLTGYTKSGMIGRIGDSEPFVVGSYLETTANDSGMLQLRVNDGGTHDNEGIIMMLVSLGD